MSLGVALSMLGSRVTYHLLL